MSPEPSFTQYLREEGFIQGPDGEDKAAAPTKTEKTNVAKETIESQKENIKEEAKTQKDIVKEEVTTPSNNTKGGISPLLIALIVVVILIIIIILL